VHDLIHTKLAPPVWMGSQIRRDALLAQLDQALERRLTIVHAPAGYGKTSLLSQWRQRFVPDLVLVAWLTLESEDSDLKRLVEYLSVALGQSGGAEGEEGERLSADLPARAALSAIINRLAKESRPIVLIFDDYHRAESAAVKTFLQSLIRLAPENCHFVVASRDYPRLGQSVLAAEEQLLELTTAELKFSAQETEALLARNSDVTLDSDEIRRIFEGTEGWPIALQLTTLSLKRGIDRERLIEGLGGPSSELARYLSEQVFTALPPETQDVVLRTALIDGVTGDIVNMLCGREDGWLVLERLEQQGVFLTPLSPDRQQYRYHHLFAQYLRERLARRDIGRFRALHRTAAHWFADHGEVVEAVSHAIQSDDDALLAEIVEQAGGWRLIPQGMMGIVERSLAKIPAAVVAARPRLLLAKVYLQIKCGEMSGARGDFDRFASAADSIELSAELRTEIRIVADVLAEYENAPVTLDDLLEREALLRSLPTNDHLLLGNLYESLGAQYYQTGALERALEPTLAAREHHQALGSLYADLFTRFMEARIKRAQGRLKEAAGILDAAMLQIEDSFGARSDLAANAAAFKAESLYEENRLPEAAALLEWALPHMEQSDGWVDVYAAAYFTAARLLAAEGSMEEVRLMLARAGRLARRRRFRQLELLAQLCALQLQIDSGLDDEAARATADEIALDALADEMALESPVYRQVAVMAGLCRAKLALVEEDPSAALAELAGLKRWANRHGAGRLLIEINLLTAYALRATGEGAAAQSLFDGAVGAAMFQGIMRPFIDTRRFVAPLLEVTLESTSQVDRFRAQFLRNLSKSFASRPLGAGAQGLLSDAEAAILDHLNQGYSNKEIARRIGMSPDTVKYRLKSLFRKIEVGKRRDAVRVARERGLIVEDGAAAAPEAA